MALIGTFLALATLGVVEFGFRMFKRANWLKDPKSSHSTFIQEGYYEKFWMYDNDFGFKPRPNVRVTCTKQYNDGEIIYNANYTTDKLSRRLTPVDSPDQRDKFAVFFGCSFTFGDGLNDEETLPISLESLRHIICHTIIYFVNPPGLEIAEARNDAASFVEVGKLLRKSGINVIDFSEFQQTCGGSNCEVSAN